MKTSQAVKKYRIKPGQSVNLRKIDAGDTRLCKDKKDARKKVEKLNVHLDALQELLYAAHSPKVLVVLQGMDTSGKDGVIRHVFEGVNPQGVKVAAFKAPSKLEQDHDYLWRIHFHAPAKGEIVIFNRSHYEDVLAVRVHDLVPKDVWKARFDHINNFEKMLHDEGTTIVKFFLHISNAEQKRRLEERLADKRKNWKLSPADVKERPLWNKYLKAFDDAIEKTSTPWAPWFVVPANNKWYRDLVISMIMVHTLESLDLKLPKPAPELKKLVIP